MPASGICGSRMIRDGRTRIDVTQPQKPRLSGTSSIMMCERGLRKTTVEFSAPPNRRESVQLSTRRRPQRIAFS